MTSMTAAVNTSTDHDGWQYCPKKQGQLRDKALAKILLKGNRAGFAVLRLGQEVLARDSKKTGYFPARLVSEDNSDKPVSDDHVRIHYDGRPEGEYRDVPTALVYYLPDHNCDGYHHMNSLLSPWVLLDEMHNFENTPLLAYSKVFERTDFRKMRMLFDGSFEIMDRLGRIVKVKPEWIHQHSTVHPDAIEEAQREAQNHEQFLDLIYGVTHTHASTPDLIREQSTKLNSPAHAPRILYGSHKSQPYWLPAAFASALHAYAEDRRLPHLKDCARTIFQRGKKLGIDSKLRANFVDLVNRVTNPLGHRIEALRFFHLLHRCPEAGSAPVVASIYQGNGHGRCVSFYRNWVFEPASQYATERTPEGLQQLYGKGDYSTAAWSYCLVPIRLALRNNPTPHLNAGAGLFKKNKTRGRKRSRNFACPSNVPSKRAR